MPSFVLRQIYWFYLELSSRSVLSVLYKADSTCVSYLNKSEEDWRFSRWVLLDVQRLVTRVIPDNINWSWVRQWSGTLERLTRALWRSEMLCEIFPPAGLSPSLKWEACDDCSQSLSLYWVKSRKQGLFIKAQWHRFNTQLPWQQLKKSPLSI